MNIQELTARALEIRGKFDQANCAAGRRAWTREEVMHGFVGDVGDLMKAIMAKQGIRVVPDLEARLEHELADCLWSVLVLAHEYGVNLEDAFGKTMTGIEAKLATAEKSPV